MNFQNQQKKPNPVQVSVARLKKIMMQNDAVELNKYADELGKYYSDGKVNGKLTTSQIRNFLDEIQKMKVYDAYKLQLLRPKLAYAAGRHKGKVKEFRDLVEELIKFTNKDNFNIFKYFIEAIVAYHIYHGGK